VLVLPLTRAVVLQGPTWFAAVGKAAQAAAAANHLCKEEDGGRENQGEEHETEQEEERASYLQIRSPNCAAAAIGEEGAKP